MRFLAPQFLWALGAAALPVVIHLVNRRKPQVVVFPSLRLLRSVIVPRQRASRLREILLLILRTLAVLFIVLSFSRPAITRGTGWSIAGASRSAVVLVDCSASMAAVGPAGPANSVAKRRAEEIIGMMRGGDEVAVVGFHNALTEPITLTADIEKARRSIETLPATDRATAVGQALAASISALSERTSLHRDVYLVTDLARTGWRDVTQALSEVDASGVRLIVVPVRAAESNVAVVDVAPRGLPAVGEAWTIAATVRNFGSEPTGELGAVLALDGTAIARGSISLGPHEQGEVLLSFTPNARGLHSAAIAIDEDARPNDNSRAFAFELPEATRVFVIADDEAVRTAVPLALDPQGDGAAGFAVRAAGSGALGPLDTAQVDVVILADAKLDAATARRLTRFTDDGGGILVWCANVDDSALPALLDGTGVAAEKRRGDVSGRGAAFHVSWIDAAHPIFSPFRESVERRGAPGWEDRVSRRLAPSGRARTIAKYENGEPAIVEAQSGSGAVVICAGSLKPDESDLLYRAAFVPFVVRAAETLARGAASSWPGSVVGQEADVAVPASDGPLTIAMPGSDEELPALPSFRSGAAVVTLLASDRAGVARVAAAGRTIALWPLAIDPAECDPAPITEEEIRALWPGEAIVLPSGNVEEGLASLRRGIELWPIALIGALVALAAETWVARTRKDEREEG